MDLKVQLPDKNVVTVSMPKNATAEVVFLAVIERIHLQKKSARYFYLFETVEDMFGKCKKKCSCAGNMHLYQELLKFYW